MQSLDSGVIAKYWIPVKVVPTFEEANRGRFGVGD